MELVDENKGELQTEDSAAHCLHTMTAGSCCYVPACACAAQQDTTHQVWKLIVHAEAPSKVQPETYAVLRAIAQQWYIR